MNIVLVCKGKLPDLSYNDPERIVVWLGKALSEMGHTVTFLCKKGSECPHGTVLVYNDKLPIDDQLPPDTDLVHVHFMPKDPIQKSHLITYHELSPNLTTIPANTVFVSEKHASLYGGSAYVHYGVDFSEYGDPDPEMARLYFHFMGNAAWAGKNVKGAVEMAAAIGKRLHVIGGTRVNFRKKVRITLNPNVRFHGVLHADGRNTMVQMSKGLLLPIIWHEPSILAVPESLYFGCPVFGTPYGALPELLMMDQTRPHNRPKQGTIDAVYAETGLLSTKKSEIMEAMNNSESYDRKRCKEYAITYFDYKRMGLDYIKLYEQVLNGKPIHPEPIVVPTPLETKPLPLR